MIISLIACVIIFIVFNVSVATSSVSKPVDDLAVIDIAWLTGIGLLSFWVYEDHRRSVQFHRWMRASKRADAIHTIRKARQKAEQDARNRELFARSPEQERQQQEARAAALAAERSRNLEDRASKLTVHYAPFENYSDPNFVEDYARHNTDDLVANRAVIVREYIELHDPPEFAELLKHRSPGTYERATWRMRALVHAERFAIQRPNANAVAEGVDASGGDTRQQSPSDSDPFAIVEERIKKVAAIPEVLAKYPSLEPRERAIAERWLQDALLSDTDSRPRRVE